MQEGQAFTVGEWKAHPRLNELTGPKGTARVEPRSMQVLEELARHSGEVRTRGELLDAVWGDLFVGEEALSHCIWDLRRAFADDARKPSYIQTVPRRGYRLIASVSWLEPDAGETDRYERREKIGGGGMGEVWKAEDTRLKRLVALKFLPPELSRDPAAKRQLLREARAAAALDHPNICTVHDVDETHDGRLFLVMALYEGRTLKERLARGALPWREAASLALDLAEGLDFAHTAGIVHRDVKPGNVIVTESGEAKILDFGLARSMDVTEMTQAATSPGTPAYMSPEQLAGERTDARTDIWSLGVLLYELLAGRRPFSGDNSQTVIQGILHREPPALPDDVPEPLARAVRAALEKDPCRRTATAGKVAAALRPLVRAPATDQAAGEGSRAGATSGPRRRAAWLGLAAALALLTAGTLYLAGDREPEPVRVAVLPPDTRVAEREPLRLAATGVHMAALDVIAELMGTSPVETEELLDGVDSALDQARAVAADEVLRITLLGPVDGLCQVSLRRIRGSDGEVLWSDAFEAPFAAADLRPLYDAVRLRLRNAYARYELAEGGGRAEVSDGDYAVFLEIQHAADNDPGDVEVMLARLQTVLETSPSFTAAHLLAANLAHSLYTRSRRDAHLDAGLRHARAARRLVPADVRPRVSEYALLLAANRHDEASLSLEEITAIDPSYHALPVLRARLAAKQGRTEEARENLLAAVERYPSWQRLLRLADFEFRHGRPEASKVALERLLERSPTNPWGLAKLAEVEMLYGDIERAEALYENLTRSDAPKIGDRINLGLARLLLGRLEAAVETLRAALDAHPGHPTVLLNLADAEMALGDETAARDHYRQALDSLGDDLNPTETMFEAQCLVHLGRPVEAVRRTQEAVGRAPDNPEVIFLAAIVYTAAGETTSALVNAQRARAMGVQRIWFELPVFDSLRGDESFRALLSGDGST